MEEKKIDEIRQNANLSLFAQILEENVIPYKSMDVQSWKNVKIFLEKLPQSIFDRIYASIVLIPQIDELTLPNITEALQDLQIGFKKMEVKSKSKALSFLQSLPVEELRGILRLCTTFPIISKKATLAKVKEAAQTLGLPSLSSDFNSWAKVAQWIVELTDSNFEAIIKEVLIELIKKKGGTMEDFQKLAEDKFDSKSGTLKTEGLIRERLRTLSISELDEFEDDVLDILDEIHAAEEEVEEPEIEEKYDAEEEKNKQRVQKIEDQIENVDRFVSDPKIIKLQRLLQKSSRIKIDDMAAVLNVTRPTLIDKLLELPDSYDFKIEEDIVIVGKEGTQEFITQMDKMFKEWGAPSEKNSEKPP